MLHYMELEQYSPIRCEQPIEFASHTQWYTISSQMYNQFEKETVSCIFEVHEEVSIIFTLTDHKPLLTLLD